VNELIQICYDTETPTVSGRELHAALEVATQYKDGSPAMRVWFQEGRDFAQF
jgi:phage anti-repressor protein